MKKTVALAVATAFGLSAGLAHAAGQAAYFEPQTAWSGPTDLLAMNESPATEAQRAKRPLHVDFEEPTWTGEKMHQYLGLATLGFVAIAAVSPKEDGGPHEMFANAAAVTAGATVGTGLVYHWEDFDLDDGWSEPDNLHMLLGSAGALLMAAAVSRAPEGGHQGMGIGGGLLMATAVKITW